LVFLWQSSSQAQERARLHDEGYALITAQNAAAAATRGRQTGRGERAKTFPLTAYIASATVSNARYNKELERE
jgi:hypothetical protein